MIDTKHIDLMSLIDTPLKRVAATEGGEYHGPCPFCGGKDRFIVQPHKAKPACFCRKCGFTGDAIAYVQKRDNVDFTSALKALRIESAQVKNPKRRQTIAKVNHSPSASSLKDDYIALNDGEYQVAAKAFVDQAQDNLRENINPKAREYLITERFLTPEVIDSARLGYNPEGHHAQWGEAKVYLPRGIVIPWMFQGNVWKVNIRQPQGTPKYLPAKGWANGLYFERPYKYSPINSRSWVFLFESEFDALAMKSQCALFKPTVSDGINFQVAATGGATLAQVQRWVWDIATAERIFLGFDADDAGDKAAEWWAGQNPLAGKTVRLRPEEGCKDASDMIAKYGGDALGAAQLVDWVLESM